MGARRKIRSVLVGLGRIGWMLERDALRYHPCTHAGSMNALPRFEILAGCDLQSSRRAEFGRWMESSNGGEGGSIVRLFDSVKELARAIQNREFSMDLAVIGTGPDSHPGIFRELALAGVKTFLIEKPVALDLMAARKMERLARRLNARVFVNFERRYHPAYRLIKKIIDEQRYGPLRHIEGRVLSSSGGRRGPLLEDGIHWIDLLLWYAGEPRNVVSRYRLDRGKEEKSSLHVFEYANFDAVFESGGDRRYFEFLMRLDFERGRIIAGNDGHFHFECGASTRYAGFQELRPGREPPAVKNPWIEMYEEIGGGRHCSSPLREAVKGLKWIDRCRSFK